MLLKFLILAGGGGTRLWPLSKKAWPKQFLSLCPKGQGKSLLTETILRVCPTPDALEHVFVVTSSALYQTVLKTCEGDGMQGLHNNIIAEPLPRNTAPAIALAVQYIEEALQKQPNLADSSDDEVLAILPADHRMDDSPAFRQQLQEAEALAKQGYIVTFGIVPSFPATGYGYIQVEQPIRSAPWQAVERFVEKPNAEKAQAFLETQRFLWNAGIFVATLGTLKQAFANYAPPIAEQTRQGYSKAFLNFAEMPNLSFDYAVMEHAKKVAVMPLATSWSDVGSWDSVFDACQSDASGNRSLALKPPVFTNSNNVSVWSDTGRRIATLGLEDCVVIDTGDSVLVSHTNALQQVKDVVSELSAQACPTVVGHKTPQALRPVHRLPWGTLQTLSAEADALPVYELQLEGGHFLQLTMTAQPCFITLLSGRLFCENANDDLAQGWSTSLYAEEPLNVIAYSTDALNASTGASLLLVGHLPQLKALKAQSSLKTTQMQSQAISAKS